MKAIASIVSMSILLSILYNRHSPNYKEITISGGEPLMHRQFNDVLTSIRNLGGEYVTITTNGYYLTEELLDFVEELKFERLMFSISVDSIDPQRHDSFRHYEGALKKATKALERISKRASDKLVPSMKSVVMPDDISEMEERAKLADSLGCKRLSFTSVIYSGKAKNDSRFWMNSDEKHRFLEEIYRLKTLFPNINVTTNDPLKCNVRGFWDESENDDEIVMDGCPAATVSFNVNSDGTMTPCSLLDIPMMNVFEMSVDEIAEKYCNNYITKMFLEMKLKGKCGRCSKKYACSGCRARALAVSGDIMGEDPECWM